MASLAADMPVSAATCVDVEAACRFASHECTNLVLPKPRNQLTNTRVAWDEAVFDDADDTEELLAGKPSWSPARL
jgi:hypothetical protein